MLSARRRIEVTWLDSCSPDGVHYWAAAGTLRTEPLVITTRGFLLKETKKAVVIAASVAEGGAPGGVLVIPKLSITNRTDG